jgi:selenocysteine-specific elongation factor
VRKVAKPVGYVDALASAGLLERVDVALREAHKTAPWSMGLTSLALSRTLATEEPLLMRILASAVEDGDLVYRGGYYATLDFTPQLTDAQRAFFETAIPFDPAQPCLPASLPEVVTAMKQARIDGLSAAFDMLVATGAAVKVGETLYRGTQIADIRAKLEAALRRDHEITASAFRDLIGTSRKYTIPLLEWFDATGVTVRSGDLRMLRVKPAIPAPRS